MRSLVILMFCLAGLLRVKANALDRLREIENVAAQLENELKMREMSDNMKMEKEKAREIMEKSKKELSPAASFQTLSEEAKEEVRNVLENLLAAAVKREEDHEQQQKDIHDAMEKARTERKERNELEAVIAAVRRKVEAQKAEKEVLPEKRIAIAPFSAVRDIVEPAKRKMSLFKPAHLARKTPGSEKKDNSSDWDSAADISNSSSKMMDLEDEDTRANQEDIQDLLERREQFREEQLKRSMIAIAKLKKNMEDREMAGDQEEMEKKEELHQEQLRQKKMAIEKAKKNVSERAMLRRAEVKSQSAITKKAAKDAQFFEELSDILKLVSGQQSN